MPRNCFERNTRGKETGTPTGTVRAKHRPRILGSRQPLDSTKVGGGVDGTRAHSRSAKLDAMCLRPSSPATRRAKRGLVAGSTGLEPAASGVTGRSQRQHIAADPGESASAVSQSGRPRSVVGACSGKSSKFLQADEAPSRRFVVRMSALDTPWLSTHEWPARRSYASFRHC